MKECLPIASYKNIKVGDLVLRDNLCLFKVRRFSDTNAVLTNHDEETQGDVLEISSEISRLQFPDYQIADYLTGINKEFNDWEVSFKDFEVKDDEIQFKRQDDHAGTVIDFPTSYKKAEHVCYLYKDHEVLDTAYKIKGIDREDGQIFVRLYAGLDRSRTVYLKEALIFKDQQMADDYILFSKGKYLIKDRKDIKKKNKAGAIFSSGDYFKYIKLLSPDNSASGRIMGVYSDCVFLYGVSEPFSLDWLDKIEPITKKEFIKIRDDAVYLKISKGILKVLDASIKDDTTSIQTTLTQLVKMSRKRDLKLKELNEAKLGGEAMIEFVADRLNKSLSALKNHNNVDGTHLTESGTLNLTLKNMEIVGCEVCGKDIINEMKKRLKVEKIDLPRMTFSIDLVNPKIKMINSNVDSFPYIIDFPPHCQHAESICFGDMQTDIAKALRNYDFELVVECCKRMVEFVNGSSAYRQYDSWFDEEKYKEFITLKK